MRIDRDTGRRIFSIQVRSAMAEGNVNQQELVEVAAIYGISYRTIDRVIKGQTLPHLDTVSVLLRGLHKNFDQLCAWTVPVSNTEATVSPSVATRLHGYLIERDILPSELIQQVVEQGNNKSETLRILWGEVRDPGIQTLNRYLTILDVDLDIFLGFDDPAIGVLVADVAGAGLSKEDQRLMAITLRSDIRQRRQNPKYF